MILFGLERFGGTRIRTSALAALMATSCLAQSAAGALLEPGDIVTTAYIGNDFSDSGVVLIDPTTGDRTIISDNTHGSGPAFSQAAGVTITPSGQLLIGDSAAGTLYEVDPATGNRTIVSGSGVGTGPALNNLVAPRAFGNQFIAISTNPTNEIFSIDPTTGNRTLISGGGQGTGPALYYSTSGIVSGPNSFFITNLGQGQILNVDLATGNRTLISGGSTGTGPAMKFPADLQFDHSGDLIVSDEEGPALYRIDPITGNRTVISSNTVGSGPSFGTAELTGLGIEANGMIAVNVQGLGAVYLVDPISGTARFSPTARMEPAPIYWPRSVWRSFPRPSPRRSSWRQSAPRQSPSPYCVGGVGRLDVKLHHDDPHLVGQALAVAERTCQARC